MGRPGVAADHAGVLLVDGGVEDVRDGHVMATVGLVFSGQKAVVHEKEKNKGNT